MNKETKKTINKSLHQLKQQGRKLDLLLAEVEKHSEQLKNLQNYKPSTNRHKSTKSSKM